MAQFVTHIQPTLVEASHHHVPHLGGKDHHHGKDHHLKDHHGKEHHGRLDHHDSTSESHFKDIQVHQGTCLIPREGHARDFPVLPHHHVDHHHEHHDSKNGHKRDSGHYLDSHGVPHSYQMHFVDSQGIYRDYHGHAIDVDRDYHEKEKHHKKEHKEKDHKERKEHYEEKKSPYMEESSPRPIPPQFINLHGNEPVENKHMRWIVEEYEDAKGPSTSSKPPSHEKTLL